MMQISQSGFLEVDTIHSIYYEHRGNIDGPCFLFLHGGPGIGTSEQDYDFFDLEKVNVVLMDQRGAGRSKPKACLEENTTQHLLKDIERLLDHLEQESVYLFGGSWGSVLAFYLAIERPHLVKGMILRGLFTASKRERSYFERGGTALFYPKVWARFLTQVPQLNQENPSEYYFQGILKEDQAVASHLAYELALYGLSIARRDMTVEHAENLIQQSDYLTRGRILAHYSTHDFFLPDNYIFDHLPKIGPIPVYLIQGRFDFITPPYIAIELAAKLKNSTLHLVDGGHSPREETMFAPLSAAIQELSKGSKVDYAL